MDKNTASGIFGTRDMLQDQIERLKADFSTLSTRMDGIQAELRAMEEQFERTSVRIIKRLEVQESLNRERLNRA